MFFNCFAFGNGAESYKIRDSVVGRSFNLGNRVTAVSEQDYREVDRSADITYSGIYNDESNLNKLNEFNLGLLNFKALEDSFGPIYMMDARETDVLVLQEDKISYVLAGKNLLSDSAAGGAITSVPQVLGTQIARVEKYGISFNPESYVQWGYDRYFTDVKRGAVIQIKGNSYTNDNLMVVSELGMRTWFRDEFITSFNTQKLGGYDPYMDEYVLVSNEIELPAADDCVECGISQTLSFFEPEGSTFTYCVDLGAYVGSVDINYVFSSTDPASTFKVKATYNGTVYTTAFINTSGTLNFTKTSNVVNTVEIEITTTGLATLKMTANCPVQQFMNVVEVMLTSDSDGGQTIHAQYRYVDGTYTSPLQSTFVTFVNGTTNPLVSRYAITNGPQGAGNIPTDNSTVAIISNKFPTDTFVFDSLNDIFRYLRTNTLYPNTTVGINALIAASNLGSPILSTGDVSQITFNAGSSGDYLYLIWDFRASVASELCYSDISLEDVCCDCGPCVDPCSYYEFQNTGETSGQVQYNTCGGSPVLVTIPIGESANLCGSNLTPPTVLSGDITITVIQECGCPS
jgi:hypothetical protein